MTPPEPPRLGRGDPGPPPPPGGRAAPAGPPPPPPPPPPPATRRVPRPLPPPAPPRLRPDFGGGQGGRVVVGGARAAVAGERGQGEGQGEPGAELGADVRVAEARRHGVGPHPDRLDRLRGERPARHQRLDTVERAVD